MKQDYVAPELEDLGSLHEQTQALRLFGVKLDGDGPRGGGGGRFS